jgi:hypothetical protein
MKPKHYISLFFIMALSFILGVLAIAIYPFKLSAPNVAVDVFDKRYACGDCYIRFGISDVPGDSNVDDKNNRSTSPNRFNGWDILISYKGDTSYLEYYQADRLAKNPDCGWPIFRLTGQFKRRLIYALIYEGDDYDGIYFDAQSGIAINTNPDCKTYPKEIVLGE